MYGTFSAQAKKTQALLALVVASGVRASCGRQALVDLKKLEYLTTDADYITRSFYYVMSSLDCVRAHTRLLTYGTVDDILEDKPYVQYVGSPEDGMSSSLSASSTATAYSAMFGNACNFLRDSAKAGFNMTACENFGNGVLTLGLAATIDLWWQTAYIAADRQLRGVFIIGNLLPSTGWSLPAETFNYSALSCLESKACKPYYVQEPLLEGVTAPSFVSVASYIGDALPSQYPGDGVIGPTGIEIVNGSVPYSSAYELTTEGMVFLEKADELYLTPGLMALAALYAKDALDSNQAFLNIVAYFIPFFMSAFALIIVVYFLPETVRENKRMQTKRAMLLYLPVYVVSKITSIRELIREIVQSEAGPLANVRPDDRAGRS